MSLSKSFFPNLNWGLKLEILSFLTIKEVWILGNASRGAFVTFLREKEYRRGKAFNTSIFLPIGYKPETVCLCSYPRSGNSYLRKLLELATGIVTGSDSRPNRTLSTSLLRYGFIGEGICDESVWVVKSHYPERLGYMRVNAKRIIVLVRNPFDAIESYFHMGLTNTHDKTLAPQVRVSLEHIWDEFVTHEAAIWAEFHAYWLRCRHMHGLPMLFVRYEDLLMRKDETMSRIVDFMLEGGEPLGIAMKNIRKYFESVETQPLGGVPGPGYRPRQGGIGKALLRMNEQQVREVLLRTSDMLTVFGYRVIIQEVSNCNEKMSAACITMNLEVDPVVYNGTTSPAVELAIPSLSLSLGYKSQTCIETEKMMTINDSLCIRSDEDKFGRRITNLRKSLTTNDTEPFAVNVE